VSNRVDALRPLAARLWDSRWPEAAWLTFAAGNLAWMVLVPSWSSLPFHFTWMSLLLLYGLGYRTWSRALTWTLLVPVMTATGLLFLDARIRGLQPYDEVIELPMMILMLTVMTRLTERRRADLARLDELSRHNQALLEQQRAFVQNASHELRTPITVALAHAELLPRPGTDPTAAEDAAIVADELARLRRLTDRLLLLATAEAPHGLRRELLSLDTVIADTLRRWEALPRQWLDGGCPGGATVFGDPDRLIVALDALIDNAIRFTRDGDRIGLSVRNHGEEVGIIVADSGPGIPEGELGSVFDRFNTVGAQRDTAHNFGLGLAIVRAIVDAHTGRVTANRSHLGGAEITLWLPAYEPVLPLVAPAAANVTFGARNRDLSP
jgi:signal transduction histidine kinase